MTRLSLGVIALTQAACGSIAAEPPPDASTVAAPLSFQLGVDNQRTTSQLRWSKHTASSLASGQLALAVCSDHFPAGSAARLEIEGAVGLYNTVVASDARVTVTDEPHRSVAELFSTPPTVSHIEYVDTLDQAYAGFPCHPDKTDATCTSWVMNTCRYRGGDKGGWSRGTGKVSNFVVSINRNCYDHFSDPTSKDYPRVSGVAHELGHGFGMGHTTDWPEADRDLISTMQGNLSVLSAYDVAFMRHFYPAEGTSAHILASPRIRLKSGEKHSNCYASEPGGEQAAFPGQLYRDGAEWKDCATGATPKLMFVWFNDGTAPLSDVRGALTIGDRAIAEWTAGDLEAASQDAIAETLGLSPGHFVDLPTGVALPARLDISSAASEGISSSYLTLSVALRDSQAACSATRASECSGP